MPFKTLEYYYYSGEYVVFDKYEIDENTTVRNKKTNKNIGKYLLNGYHKINVNDEYEKSRGISVARAMLSTFVGKPPTVHHTADHINSSEKTDDSLENLRWADKSEQSSNQTRPKTLNNAFLIRHGDEYMTIKEWALRENVHEDTIRWRARDDTSWHFKEYEDLPWETWLRVEDSKNLKGFWKVSDKKRAAYHTNNARKVYSTYEMRKINGYPVICINGKHEYLHVVVFRTFRPDDYAKMNSGDVIMHCNDDKLDCDPLTLKIGTRSENAKNAHDNGRHDGKKTQRRKCACYKDDELIKCFDSLADAERWLHTKNPKASFTAIIKCLSGKLKTAYGYVWKDLQLEQS